MNDVSDSDVSDQVRQALDPIGTMLSADGYRLVVNEGADTDVTVAIEATDDACEECLVPKTVFGPMIDTLLEQQGMGEVSVDLRYPVDA